MECGSRIRYGIMLPQLGGDIMVPPPRHHHQYNNYQMVPTIIKWYNAGSGNGNGIIMPMEYGSRIPYGIRLPPSSTISR